MDKKKLIAIAVAALTLVSCGKSGDADSEPPETAATATAATTKVTTLATTTAMTTEPEEPDSEWSVDFLSADVCKKITNENGVKLWSDEADEGMVYLIIYLKVTSNIKDDWIIAPYSGDFTCLVDYKETETSSITNKPKGYPRDFGSRIEAGENTVGCLVYEIPENWSYAELKDKETGERVVEISSGDYQTQNSVQGRDDEIIDLFQEAAKDTVLD